MQYDEKKRKDFSGNACGEIFAAEVGKHIFFDELPQQHLANTGELKCHRYWSELFCEISSFQPLQQITVYPGFISDSGVQS
jgi:hypothetical protein